MSDFSPLILGIGGTARPNSSSERSVRVALAAAEKMGARTILIDGPHLARLPLYAPDRVERTDDEAALVEAARSCHGIIVATPGYHGSLSGPIKNALDLLEDTSRDARTYLDGCAFGAIVTAFGWMACGTTMVTLRSIAHALRAWPTPYGAALNASTPLFESDGSCIDSKVEGQLAIVAQQVVDFARWRHAGLSS
ncbi:NADPH-dependent FMN reductase [Sphingomonas sp. MMS24-J13]|uniref:NADPH-dependent FMN reductase n=1 Tax=Sphingomonas sp. MMS24-J13 TaxID=3238686 RepID=UPI00384F27AF